MQTDKETDKQTDGQTSRHTDMWWHLENSNSSYCAEHSISRVERTLILDVALNKFVSLQDDTT